MELVLEIRKTRQTLPAHVLSRTFDGAGGMIGRASDCDWVIPDASKQLSGRHARVTCHRGAFYVTDVSRNGVFSATGAQLPKGKAFRIEHGAVYRMSDFEIQARVLREPSVIDAEVGLPQPAGSVVADALSEVLDPLLLMAHSNTYDILASLDQAPGESPQRANYARVDTEHLPLPELVAAVLQPPPAAPVTTAMGEPVSANFWHTFGQALAVDLSALELPAREALAIKAAGLLAQSVKGLQQSLRTQSELKREMHLAAQSTPHSPLTNAPDSAQALRDMLQPSAPRQRCAEQAIGRAFHDLQVHQVALLGASRAALRAGLEHLAPHRLVLHFEREDKRPLFATAGSRWRAYGRYYQRLQDEAFSEQVLAGDFAQAYDEQVRLVCTLHTEPQG